MGLQYFIPLAIVAGLLTSCGPGEDLSNSANESEGVIDFSAAELGEANATENLLLAVAGDDQSVIENNLVSLIGTGVGSESAIVNFEWAQINGIPVVLASASNASTSFLAPTLTEETQLTFQLSVIDSAGASASDTVTISVLPINETPIVEAGDPQIVSANDTVTLRGVANDPDGFITEYRWTQLSGINATLDDVASVDLTFVAPSVDEESSLRFSLTVVDNEGAESSDDVRINIQQVAGSLNFTESPNATTQDPYATFGFTADRASAYECSLDAEEYRTCTSPHTVFPLAVGPHSFSARPIGSSDPLNDAGTVNWTVSSIFADGNAIQAHSDLIASSKIPDLAEQNSWRGIFRINCDFSHSSYNDPVVFPNQSDAAHLHRFYGNTETDHASSVASLFITGESSCQGNRLNRSSYWVPALIAPTYNSDTGERLENENGELAWQAVPAVVGNDDVAHEIFYYSAGVDDLESIEPIPLGLKMIAGNHHGKPGNEQDTSIARWHCQEWESTDAGNPLWSTSIPECLAPDRVRMDLFFPSCWNGVDLDSDDHKSHMAYPINEGGPNGTVCPETHPTPIVRVSYHYAFGVKPDVYEPESRSSRGWKLASDMYEATTNDPGGMSLHGDWVNAWHPEAMQALLDECIKQRLDCHDGNLANGFRLSGTQPGTQVTPLVFNEGLGY